MSRARRLPPGLLCLLAMMYSPFAGAETFYAPNAAILDNGAQILNGRIVQIGGDNNGSVTFANVVVAKEGLYPMTVYFTNANDATFDISVNHEIPQSVIFRRSRRGSGGSRQDVLVPLRPGGNRIVFDNAREFGPDLERIALADEPVASHVISGVVKDDAGLPLAKVTVAVSGAARRKATTDAQGRYEFRLLPEGEYRVAPRKPGEKFAPNDQLFPALAADQTGANFSGHALRAKPAQITRMESGPWRVEYDLANGVADILFDGKPVVLGAYAEARLPRSVTGMDYLNRRVSRRRVKDRFGSGVEFQVECANSSADKMAQTFWFYDGADYFLTQVKITRKAGVASNWMSPLVSDLPVALLPQGDNRALFVPFDNDKWIRYNAVPFGGTVVSHEVSALYNNASRRGLVLGSIDHDTWKTAVQSTTTTGGELDGLEVFGGITATTTRDTLPHGKISGKTIESPRIFVGFFSDWRTGLEAYARANAAVAPPRPWDGGVPFGWNSWGKLQFNISYQKAIEVSDFFARELQPRQFEDNNTVYIGLDAGWNKFTNGQLKNFAAHCKANHQEAGIYFTPFADFAGRGSAMVEGSRYRYSDIYLYANGRKQRIAGGVALDPTHPGTQARIRYTIKQFKKLGFKYVKADFMVQGSLEGDRFYDPRVTTGLQAYNAGMKFLDRILGRKMYLNLAISPLFPSPFADSRRIACDAWGDIGKSEYTLNALTYGWWLGSVYDYNDPDHVVLAGYSDGENRARVTSAVVTGLFISGDDFSKDGDPVGKAKAIRYLTNPDIDALARTRESFRPVEGDSGNRAASLFVHEDRDAVDLAVFNFSAEATNIPVSFERVGLRPGDSYRTKELWSGQTGAASSPMTVRLPAADAVIYRFYRRKK